MLLDCHAVTDSAEVAKKERPSKTVSSPSPNMATVKATFAMDFDCPKSTAKASRRLAAAAAKAIKTFKTMDGIASPH